MALDWASEVQVAIRPVLPDSLRVLCQLRLTSHSLSFQVHCGHRCFALVEFFSLICLLAVLCLCCRSRAFSSCSAWACHGSSFSCCVAWALGPQSSVVVAHELSCPEACGIFLDQGSKPSPGMARQILNHWTTREAPC